MTHKKLPNASNLDLISTLPLQGQPPPHISDLPVEAPAATSNISSPPRNGFHRVHNMTMAPRLPSLLLLGTLCLLLLATPASVKRVRWPAPLCRSVAEKERFGDLTPAQACLPDACCCEYCVPGPLVLRM